MTTMTPDPDKLPLWVDPATAAQVLAISRSTVHKLIRSGELRSKKVGKLRRIPREAIIELTS